MWRSLRDPETPALYEREFPQPHQAPSALVGLLRDLSVKEFAAGLFAVTSLGRLKLTRAPSYDREEQYDVVAILVRGSEFAVSYLPRRGNGEPVTAICKADELPGVVERFLIRLVLSSSKKVGSAQV